MPKRRVIVVTDGDRAALAAVEVAARNVQGRCISLTGGHTQGDAYLSPEDVVELVTSAPHDPVIIMVDDEGDAAEGRGEQLLQMLSQHPEIEIIGAVAVASHTKSTPGVTVDASVTRNGTFVKGAVDKEGQPTGGMQYGDTTGVLAKLSIPYIVGLGDPGKMDFTDDARNGATITTKALRSILEHQ